MADSIASLLSKRDMNEPPEVEIIKTFVFAHYQVTPMVTIQQRDIIIGVRSAALAGALRPRLRELKEACETDKRLVLRIQ